MKLFLEILKEAFCRNIRKIARTLVHGWRALIEKWFKSASQPPLSSEGDQAEHQIPINGDDDEYREKEKKISEDSENLEEKPIVEEPMRINEALCRYQDESILYESLSRSVEILKETEIGRNVNPNIRKHEWVKSAALVTQSTVTELCCSSSINPNGLLSAGAKRKQFEEEEYSERAENSKKQRLIHITAADFMMRKVHEENERGENVKKQRAQSLTAADSVNSCASNPTLQQMPEEDLNAFILRKKLYEENEIEERRYRCV